MNIEEAVYWCRDHQIDISFRLSAEDSEVHLPPETRDVTGPQRFLRAVRRIKWEHSKKKESRDEPLHRKSLAHLSFPQRNYKGRIQRLAQALDIETVGQLLDWAHEQPRGLEQITDYANIGGRTLEVLIQVLEREGVERIPTDYD